jgi:hypothetical protein
MEQEVVLDVKVKNQGLKQQLREAVKEAQSLVAAGDTSSKSYKEATKRVAELKDQLKDFNEEVKALDPGEKFQTIAGISASIAGGFQAAQGAMALFGAESKDVEKALLKVQAATALAQGIDQVREFGKYFNLAKAAIGDSIKSLFTLRGALLATGVGAFAVAIGAIVTNWKEFVSYIDKTFPALGGIEKLFDRIKKVAFGTLSSIVEGFKVVGEVIGNVFTGEFEKAIDTAGTFGSRVSAAYTKGFKEEEQKLADERAALKLEQDIKQHERNLKVIEAQGKDTYALKRKLLNEELELLKLQNKKETDEYKNKLNEIRVLDAEEKRKKAQADEDAFQKDLAERKRRLDEEWRNTKAWNEEIAKNKAEEDKKAEDKRWEDAMQAQDDINRAEEYGNAALTKLRDRHSKIYIENKQRETEAILQLAQTSLNGLVALAELGIKNEKKLEQAKKIAALVQIGIDTARAISGIVAAASMDPKNALTGGLDIPLKIAAGIVTVLANMAKAKQILSASGSSGSAPSLSTAAIPTSTSATSAGGGVTMQQGPAQQGQTIANANLINNAMNNQNMIRAVVVETDITDSQRRVRGIEDRATFG